MKCNICQYQWWPIINQHLNKKSGCPDCVGTAPWTLERFIEKSIKIHGYGHDYSQITQIHIINCKSHVPIKCNTCQYQWSPSITSYINSKIGCPDCAGVIPWSLERFIKKAVKIHGNKYDYSQITSHHIDGQKSQIPVKCNICQYQWTPTVFDHINN